MKIKIVSLTIVFLVTATVAFGQGQMVPVVPQPMTTNFPAQFALPMPQAQPIIIQSATDSAMLEAVKAGKGFSMKVELIDPAIQQWQQMQQLQYQQAQQYQYQQPMVATPYQYNSGNYCYQQQPQCNNQIYYDRCGKQIFWTGYNWAYCQQQGAAGWYPGRAMGF